MKEKLIIFVILIIKSTYGFIHDINGTLSFPWYPRCTSFTPKTPHLADCCPVAFLSFSVTDRHYCAQECLDDGGEACCYDNCYADRLQIYVDEQINIKNFFDAIMNGKEEVEGLKNVADDAIKECEANWEKKFPFAKEYEKSQTCDMPDKLYMISKCILSFVFLNCPQSAFNGSQECNMLKKSMEKCEEMTTTTTPPPTVPPPTTTVLPTLPPSTTTLPPTTTTEISLNETTGNSESTTRSLNQTTILG